MQSTTRQQAFAIIWSSLLFLLPQPRRHRINHRVVLHSRPQVAMASNGRKSLVEAIEEVNERIQSPPRPVRVPHARRVLRTMLL